MPHLHSQGRAKSYLKNMPEYGLVNGSRVVESFERRKVTTQRENVVVKDVGRHYFRRSA